MFVSNVVDRDPVADQGAGPEGLIHFFTAFRAVFPDLNISVEQLVADEDNVAIVYTLTDTHQGDSLEIPATG